MGEHECSRLRSECTLTQANVYTEGPSPSAATVTTRVPYPNALISPTTTYAVHFVHENMKRQADRAVLEHVATWFRVKVCVQDTRYASVDVLAWKR